MRNLSFYSLQKMPNCFCLFAKQILFFCLFCVLYPVVLHANIVFVGDWEEVHKDMYLYKKNPSLNDLDSLNKEVIGWYENNGFPGASLLLDTSSGIQTLTLDRGEAWVFGMVQNKGNTKTQKKLWRAIFDIEEGSPFSLKEVKKGEEKALRLGYFESTGTPLLYKETKRNRIVPVFFMEDAFVNYAEAFASYSSETKELNLSLDLFLLNMLGTARDLQIEAETGDWGRSLFMKYKEPWLFSSKWDALLVGQIEEDSLYQNASIDLGISRYIFEDLFLQVLGGVGIEDWRTSIAFEMRRLDRLVLPRTGFLIHGSMQVLQKKENAKQTSVYLKFHNSYWFHLWNAWVSRYKFELASNLPSQDYPLMDLMDLGGVETLKGYRKAFFKTRAYGFTEFQLEWQSKTNTSFLIFYQPALYRARFPEHGWKSVYSYGLGIAQYRERVQFSIYYALNPGVSFLDALLHFSVKTLF